MAYAQTLRRQTAYELNAFLLAWNAILELNTPAETLDLVVCKRSHRDRCARLGGLGAFCPLDMNSPLKLI